MNQRYTKSQRINTKKHRKRYTNTHDPAFADRREGQRYATRLTTNPARGLTKGEAAGEHRTRITQISQEDDYVITCNDGSMKIRSRKTTQERVGYHTGRGRKGKGKRRYGKTCRSIRRRNAGAVEELGNSDRVPTRNARIAQKTVKNYIVRRQHVLGRGDDERKLRTKPTNIAEIRGKGDDPPRQEQKGEHRSTMSPRTHGHRRKRQGRRDSEGGNRTRARNRSHHHSEAPPATSR